MIKIFDSLGIETVYDEENNATYYFTEAMLLNNIVIEEAITELPNEEGSFPEFQTHVTVNYLNRVGAHSFGLYVGEVLHSIQLHRILKDIIELFKYNSMGEFLTAMKNYSSQYMSSKMQSDPVHKKSVYDWIGYPIQFCQNINK